MSLFAAQSFYRSNASTVFIVTPLLLISNACLVDNDVTCHSETGSCRDHDVDVSTGSGRHLTQCDVIAQEFPYYCRTLGGDDNVCCKSCLGVGECAHTLAREITKY